MCKNLKKKRQKLNFLQKHDESHCLKTLHSLSFTVMILYVFSMFFVKVEIKNLPSYSKT